MTAECQVPGGSCRLNGVNVNKPRLRDCDNSSSVITDNDQS